MRSRGLLLVAIAIVGGLAVWWAQQAGAPSAPTPAETDDEHTLIGRPGLAADRPKPKPVTVDAVPAPVREKGPCVIRGKVLHDGKPVVANVQLRTLDGVMTDMRSLMQPVFGTRPPLAETQSEDDGTFRFDDLPAGSYRVRAHADGVVAWQRVFCNAARARTPVTLYLYGGDETLNARAQYADGRPFRGLVSIGLAGAARGGWMPEVATDATGQFRVDGLKPGKATVNFILPATFRSGVSVTLPLEKDHVFVVDEGLTWFAGRVIADDTEEPIASARLAYDAQVDGRRYTSQTTSDDQGAFKLFMPGRQARLWVEKEGFEKLQASTKKDDEGEIVFRLKRRGVVAGRVVRKSDGTPVAGVAVHASGWYTFGLKSPLDVSAEDGSYQGEVGPGRGTLYALGNGWLSEGLSLMKDRSINPLLLELAQGASASRDLVVVRAATIEGVVRDAAGAVVQGAVVAAELPFSTWRGFRHQYVGEENQHATDDEGRFRLVNLVPGFPYHVVARTPEGLPGQNEPPPLASGETRQIEIVVPAERWLPIRVVEKGSGTPVEGATVNARQKGHAASGTTDADGRLRLGPLLPAPLTVSAFHHDFLRPHGFPMQARGDSVADPGASPDTHVMELERGGFFEGSIYTVDGTLHEGDMLGIYAVDGPVKGLGLSGLFPIQGKPFRVGPVPAGTYDLVLVRPAGGHQYRQICRWTAETGDKDLVLRIDPALEEGDEQVTYLDVTGPDGKPAMGFVRVLTKQGVIQNGPFLQMGRFEIRRVPQGTPVWIEIRSVADSARNPLPDILHGPVVLEPGSFPLELKAGTPITGIVRAPDGTPLSGILVTQIATLPDDVAALRSNFASPSRRTDAQGRFSLPGMASTVVLLVDAPANLGLPAPVRVEPSRREVEIRLASGVDYDVRVTDPDGAKLAGVRVTASLAHGTTKRLAVTNADGVATLHGLVPEAVYGLQVGAPPGRSDLCEDLQPRWVAAATTVTLPAGRHVEGLVMDGKSYLPHGTVFWKDPRGVWRREAADMQGKFRITVPTGPVVLVGAPNQCGDRAGGGPAVTVDGNTKAVRLPIR